MVVRWAASLCILGLLVPAAARGQRGSITGVVVARETNEPLAYSIVAIAAAGREQFTTDSGTFTIGDLPAGPVRLTVRRLGFSPAEVTVQITEGATHVVIPLTRIAVQLGAVTVRAHPPCTAPGPPSDSGNATLATLFMQLRMNAEQFRMLTAQYPFISAMDARRIHKAPGRDPTEVGRSVIPVASERDQWAYQPGRVVTRTPLGNDYIFNIPTLVQFADPRFLAEHCFHYAGIDTINDVPAIRIDLIAAERLRAPDVSGSLFLDPDTYQIRRSVLRLTRFPPVRGLNGFVVMTEFDEALESVPVISHVFSTQSFDTTRSRRQEAVYEDWRLIGVKWVGKKPGQDTPKAP